MTKLEAVNQVLRAAGHYNARALDTNGNSNAAEAERDIDTESKKIQAQAGWTFNTVFDITLTPDGSNNIAVVPNMIQAWSIDPRFVLTVRSGLFYNYTFLCAWDDIPEPAQQYIVALAAESFNDQRGKPERARDLREKTNVARKFAREASGAAMGDNILNTSDAQGIIGNRRTYTFGA